jgi:uncharacterized LabA/DUF88 family protein
MSKIVLIDGENFLYLLRKIYKQQNQTFDKHNPKLFKLREFLEFIVKDKTDLKIYYYGTTIRSPERFYPGNIDLQKKYQVFLNSQQTLGKTLQNNQIIFVKNGKLRISDGENCKKCNLKTPKYIEKGVDVSIAVDMIAKGNESNNNIYLLSNDTDLVPAVKYMKSINKKVVYLAYSEETTLALNKYCSILTFTFDDLKNFFA